MRPIKTKDLIDLVVEHGSYKVVGNIAGCLPEIVHQRIRRRGFTGRGKKWQVVAKYKFNMTEKEMWQKLYYDFCLTPSQLAPMFWNVTKETIRDRITKCGIKLRSRGGFNHNWERL